jgi:alpha-galactosidase
MTFGQELTKLSMLTNRRRFIKTGGGMAIGALVPFRLVADPKNLQPFQWKTGNLVFSFDVQAGKLRQKRLLPSGSFQQDDSSGVEVAMQCSGENSPDSGMKSGIGQPGARLLFAGSREESTVAGKRLICSHTDSLLNLQVDSVYEGFDGVPVVRRHSRVTNNNGAAIGVEFLSSAMLHGLADPQRYDSELRIHVAMNSWMAEGQWHTFRPSEMGFVENERTSWSQARAGSIGSWSTERYLPMAIVENLKLGLAWFWQIEHNGSWYWEISNASLRSGHADDVYAYLGGPDDLHSATWKRLGPGETYETVPVAIGCVPGGFDQAVEALIRPASIWSLRCCAASTKVGDWTRFQRKRENK